MSAPYQRQRDPQPVGQGWEALAATIGAMVLGVVFAALAGLGIASAVWGGGWVWPHGTDTIQHTLGGVLQGHPGRGLPAEQSRLVAGRGAVYGCIAAAELLLVAAAIAGGVLIARYRRPGDARGGMASRSEAAQVLGVGKLREAKAIIRPDLYGRTANNRSDRGRDDTRTVLPSRHGTQRQRCSPSQPPAETWRTPTGTCASRRTTHWHPSWCRTSRYRPQL